MIVFLLAITACWKSDSVELSTVAAHAQDCPGATGDRSDVVIVSVDTLRADRLGFAGHPESLTPTLDALAGVGHVFDQATTPLPRTTPALASVLTGLRPHRHGAREVGDRMQATSTLPAILKDNGWRTVAVSAMRVAGPEQNLDRGFDSFEVHHDLAADQLVAKALSAVSEVSSDCPMLLWVHFSDPHFPYLPPQQWVRDVPTSECRRLGERAARGDLSRVLLFSDQDGMASGVLDECRALYDGEVSFTDNAIGQLLDGLRQTRRENPVVVFTADHGENMGEWGLFFEHGPDVHDASLRVPLVIAGPDVPVGRSNKIARLEDIMPTVLTLVGLQDLSEDELDGRSLTDVWSGSDTQEWALAESGSALHARLSNYLVSGRSDRLHCIHGPQYSLCGHPNRPYKLFDRSVDIGLRHNLVSEMPEVAQRLRVAWSRWPVERTRQRAVRSHRFSLVSTPQLTGDYDLSLYDHLADPGLSDDVQSEYPEVFAQMEAVMMLWSTELDEANVVIPDRSVDQEEALRSLGYIE